MTIQQSQYDIEETEKLRVLSEAGCFEPSQLLLGISRPHQPVKACSIARWVKSVLARSGIDTGKFFSRLTQPGVLQRPRPCSQGRF